MPDEFIYTGSAVLGDSIVIAAVACDDEADVEITVDDILYDEGEPLVWEEEEQVIKIKVSFGDQETEYEITVTVTEGDD